jgi:UDP-GlcNAc:undecaprenyl-phosphate GlcNAc-1-phosphate transferase
MTVAIVFAGVTSFLVALVCTRLIVRVAPRLGFVDKPGLHKTHHQPKPLGGGIGIFLGFALPLLAGIAYVAVADAWPTALGTFAGPDDAAYFAGARQQAPLALGVVVAAAAMHLLGLFDDRRAMGPYSKLVLQLAIIAALVLTMEYLAATTPSLRLRVLTYLDAFAGGRAVSVAVTVLWIAGITNAFNFLDNMDGLSAGVAAICSTAFLLTALAVGQVFVALVLALLLGATLGFLVWNFPPARIFMGDSGSLLLGLLLGTLTVRTTYLPPGRSLTGGWYAVLAPLVVLALPLYDLLVVSAIRISRGKSPFRGDNNHFSHRLVARGMSRRTAVLCIYLVTSATSIAAMLLPHVVSTTGALFIFAQTVMVLAVVALLEQHPLPRPGLPAGGGDHAG